MTSDLIRPFYQKNLKNLSRGEQRVIEALMIIYSEADFVLLDEPFHSLSPKITAALKAAIIEQSAYKGFIISDHNYQEVLDISHQIFLLREGYLKTNTRFKKNCSGIIIFRKAFNLYI